MTTTDCIIQNVTFCLAFDFAIGLTPTNSGILLKLNCVVIISFSLVKVSIN